MVRKKIIYSIIAIVGLSTSLVTTLVVKSNDWFSNNSITRLNTTLNSNEEQNTALQPFEQINHYTPLTQKTGPIVSWKSTIKSLDWFGATRWEIDLLDQKNKYLFPNSDNSNLVRYSQRAFLAWDLDIQNNLLWLLMNPSNNNALQNAGDRDKATNILASTVVKIDSLNGKVLEVFKWVDENKTEFRVPSINDLYYQISALPDGNVLIHGRRPTTYRFSAVLNTTTKTFKNYEVNDADIKDKALKDITSDQRNRRSNRYNLLIPIAQNINILAVSDFQALGPANQIPAPTGDVYLALVKDDFSLIPTQDNNWKNLYRIENVFPWQQRNKRIADNFLSHTIYRTFKNKVYFTIYNKFFVVDTKLNGQNGLDFATYDLANSGTNLTNTSVQIPNSLDDKINAISTYTVDANENVYYKLINDTKIYNLKIDLNESNVKNTRFASTTYYDLSDNNIEEVRNNAKSFALFNVEGSTGSILAINAKQVISRSDKLPEENEAELNKYGLALAIVRNSNNDQGDSKGLLNTERRFVKSADFDIDPSTLKQKLPSEITRNDLTLKNNGFFTSNKEVNEDKTLKYLPFEIKDINDEKGTFTVIAHLDQIPWFSNTLPADFVPRKIEKKFNGAIEINKKVSWTNQTNLSYDFLNALPTKVTKNDLASFDLFQANFASQTIIGSNSQILYPKKTYSASEQNDQTGNITVNVKYEYVPLGVNYQNQNDVKVFETKQTYKIFDLKQTPQLIFAGQINANSNNPIDIKNTPVLKSFLQSSVLASSIQNLITNNQIKYTDFLDLVQTKGYPTNKMQFSLEANDQNGSLTFKATLPNDYYANKVVNGKSIKTEFVQVFNGFNRSNQYSFKFKPNLEGISINNKQATKYLPSSITSANIFANFVDTTGFDIKDFNITLIPNDQQGSLSIRVELDRTYPTSIGNNAISGFSNYVVTKTYDGFLKQDQFNEQFNVEFVNDESNAISSLKQFTLLEIENSLKNNSSGLNVNGTVYKTLNELFEKLLVTNKGIQIPSSEWSSNKNIITSMTYDNNAGTVAFFLTIKKEANQNITNDLNFVVSYKDFARGNKIQTEDNLSFITNKAFNNFSVNNNKINLNNLHSYLSNTENIKQLFSTVTGQYKTLLDNNEFELKIETSKLFNAARIEITFKNVINNKSLKTYSNTFIFDN